jgi:translocation protein SEC66
MFSLDWRGLLLPLCYVTVLGGTFVTFSTIYRKRKASTLLVPGYSTQVY